MQSALLSASAGLQARVLQTPQQPRSQRAARLVVRAEEAAATPAPKAAWAPPILDSSSPSPIFGGSTGQCKGQSAGGWGAAVAVAVAQTAPRRRRPAD